MNHFSLSLLRFLEGYWPNCLKWIGKLEYRRCEKIDERFQLLATKHNNNPESMTNNELNEFNQVYHEKMLIPDNPAQRMPTRLGNLLRSVELRPEKKYGLDSVICWPRLWLILPEEIKNELIILRETLDSAVHILMWSLLFMIWSVFTVMVIPISLILILFTYRLLLNAAETYGQLVEASFDLYRFSLYEALRWPLPSNPAEERKKGCQLTEYLYKGADPLDPGIAFTKKPEKPETS